MKVNEVRGIDRPLLTRMPTRQQQDTQTHDTRHTTRDTRHTTHDTRHTTPSLPPLVLHSPQSVAADKVSKKEIRNQLIPAQKKNAYYFNGNGRVWSQVFRVSKGQCLGCTDPTLFRPLGEGKTQFCDIDSVMAGVAANYWKGKCAPSSVKSTLQRFSTSGFHSQAVTFDAQYRSTCGKKSKTILVTGRSSDAVESENVYASIEQSGGYGGSGMQWSYGGGYWTRPC